MSGNLEHCILLLKDNTETVKSEAHRILLNVCDNILKNPYEVKFRKIDLSNPVVMNKLLPASGAIECLLEIGFIENDDGFLLPLEAPLTRIKELRRLLVPIEVNKNSLTSQKKNKDAPNPSTSNVSPIRQSLKRISFLEYISRHFKDVLRYEEPKLQEKARKLVPLTRLEIAAMEKMRMLQRNIKTITNEKELTRREISEHDYTMKDLLLLELLYWFKHEFFEWVNSPACTKCSSECSRGNVVASSNPYISRIELYKCGTCETEVEFPRYSDPEPLLTTRRGRCGEWANAFTLICRSLGYDARIVHDKTDHVWTEVWSIGCNKWLHTDPCENVMDNPLMYEKGWGKKLSYVIAYSKDEVQDVTWRYTRDQKSVMKRRTECSEWMLAKHIGTLNEQRQHSLGYSVARRNYVIKRSLLELVNMLPAPPGATKPEEEEENAKDYQGRTSGSLAWRLARGETKGKSRESFIWIIPTNCQTFKLTYFIVKDYYEVRQAGEDLGTDETKVKNGWETGIDKVEGGIFRKVETDWKMVYLARSPGAQCGRIKWTFQSRDPNLFVSLFTLKANSTTFHEGTVQWEIEGFHGVKHESSIIPIPDPSNFETDALSGVNKISLTATLTGGTDWQHAQLFRQSLESTNQHSMIINIQFSKYKP